MYLTNTRLDICFVVNALSQYMVDPRHVHLVAATHVMRYLKGTLACGLIYIAESEFRLCGYTNSDQDGNVEDRKRTLGCCFSLGSSVISWISRKQTIVSISTAEAKYIATCLSCCEAVWLHKLLAGLFNTQMGETEIYCDNQSCIKLIENLLFHNNSKNIEIKYHYIQDMMQKGAVKL